MKPRTVTAVVVLLAVPGVTRAEGLAGRLSIAVHAGTQSEVAGDAVAAASGTLVGKPATIGAKSYRDIYRPKLRLQATISYGIASHFEAFARGTYYRPEAISIEAGTFDGKTLFACFENSVANPKNDCAAPQRTEYGGEAGVRYFIAPQSRLKSYWAVVAGARHSDEMLVSFSMPDAGSAVLHVPFRHGAWVPVFGADLGFVFDITPNAFIGLESGIRYQQAPKGFDALPDLGPFDAAGGRWTAPVVATLGVRF